MRLLLTLFLLISCGQTAADAPVRPAGLGMNANGLALANEPGKGPYLAARETWTRCKADGVNSGSPYCAGNLAGAETVLASYATDFDAILSFPLPFPINATGCHYHYGKWRPPAFDANRLFAPTMPVAALSFSYSGRIEIPPGTPNGYSFIVGHSDGFRLRIHNGTSVASSFWDVGGPFLYGEWLGRNLKVAFPVEGGRFPFELVFYSWGMEADVEFLWHPGDAEYTTANAAEWTVVPKESLYAPDLRATLMAEKVGTGPVANGDQIRWVATLKNPGQTPVFPVIGQALPGNVNEAGVAFTHCLSDGLTWGGFDRVPSGLRTTTTTVDCPTTRAFGLTNQLNPGEQVTFSYLTTVDFSGRGTRLCTSGHGIGSTTEIPDLGRERIYRRTDDPDVADPSEQGNAPETLVPGSFADDDDTCVTLGAILPAFDITSPTPAFASPIARPQIAGTARPAAKVVVSLAGPAGSTFGCEASVDANGSWQCTPPSDLPDGEWTATARVRDSNGNEGPDLARAFSVRTAPLAQPTLDAVKSPTANPRPAFTGAAALYAGVTVLDARNDAVLCQAIPAASGTFSCTAMALADGMYIAKARATDGLHTVDSEPVTFTVDRTAPERPQLASPGSLLTTREPGLSGTAEADATVNIRPRASDGTLGAPACSAVATFGLFSCRPTVPLADGPYVFEADAVDAAGNVSAQCPSGRSCGNQSAFIVDLTAPPAPLFDTIASPIKNVPALAGSAETGAHVSVREGRTSLCVAIATGNRFVCPALVFAEGKHTLFGTAKDAAGNASPESPLTFVVDLTPPVKPTLEPLPTPSANTRPVFGGTAEVDSTLRVVVGDATVCIAMVGANGRWSCVPQTDLPDGSYLFAALASDAAGNESAASEPVRIVVDTTPPATPMLNSLPSPGNDARPTFAGNAEAGSTVKVFEAGAPLCIAKATESGTFACTSTVRLADGRHNVDATSTDEAGNESARANSVSWELDTVPPEPPRLHDAPSVTRDPQPILEGSAEPGSVVFVSDAQHELCVATASADGHFACRPGVPLGDGTHVVTAIATDSAANASGPSKAVAWNIDTTAPAAPVIESPTEASEITDVLVVTGVAPDAERVELLVDGAVVARGPVVRGRWTVRLDGAERPTLGAHELSAHASDAAGNRSVASRPVGVSVYGHPVLTGGCDGGCASTNATALGLVGLMLATRRRLPGRCRTVRRPVVSP